MRREVKSGERTPAGAIGPRRALLGAVLAALAATGCASSDFPNQPRPPQPIQLTAVITPSRVDVEPNEVGTGPVIIQVSNQDDRSHTISLTGNGVREVVGPINSLDTATLQKTLGEEGVYQVTAGSEEAAPSGIAPGRIFVGRGRQSNRDDVQVP